VSAVSPASQDLVVSWLRPTFSHPSPSYFQTTFICQFSLLKILFQIPF
jgi:hypothetical protein